MALFYTVVQRIIPPVDGNWVNAIKKYFPILVKSKKVVTTQMLAELIAEKSSLTPGDVHNTVRNLMSVVRTELLNSRSVKLDGLGTFTIIAGASGNGVDTPEEVNPRQINRLKIRFTPEGHRSPNGGVTRAMLEGVEYERWGSASSFSTSEEEDPDDGIDPGI